jgi:hypothetical protein
MAFRLDETSVETTVAASASVLVASSVDELVAKWAPGLAVQLARKSVAA